MPFALTLSRTTIRRLPAVLWALSLALTILLVWSLVSNLSSREVDRSRIAAFQRQARTDLARLRSRLNRVRLTDPGHHPLRDMVTASMQLRPLRPRVAETPAAESSASGGEDDDVYAEGGPLAEEWNYAGGVFVANDPSRSRVWLRRKQKANTSKRLRSRYRRIRSSRSRSVRGRSIRSSREKELISFYADEDRFEDEELELDFLVRWVDWNRIVYSRPEAPETEYVLERVDNSPYSFSKEKRLEPFAEESDVESEDDEETGHFRIRARGYVDRVEQDYQRLLHGGDDGDGDEETPPNLDL